MWKDVLIVRKLERIKTMDALDRIAKYVIEKEIYPEASILTKLFIVKLALGTIKFFDENSSRIFDFQLKKYLTESGKFIYIDYCKEIDTLAIGM